MRHSESKEISAFADGELAEPERRRVEAHLEVCASCRELLSGITELRARLGAFDHAGSQSDADRALARVLASGPDSPRRAVPLRGRTAAVPVPALAALVAALCASVGLLVAERIGEEPRTERAGPAATSGGPARSARAGGFDPSRFDRGNRIAIFVERRAPEVRP